MNGKTEEGRNENTILHGSEMNGSGDEELCGIPAIFKMGNDLEPPVKRPKMQEKHELLKKIDINKEATGDVNSYMQSKNLLVNGNVPPSNDSAAPVSSNNPFSSEIQKELPPKVNDQQIKGSVSDSNLINSKEVSSTSTSSKKATIDDIAAPDSSEDPYSYLDWKDGIATLPGSNLKFRMTEFGTLEIISTVETEKGEIEWSSSTEQHKQAKVNRPAAESGTLTNKKQAEKVKKKRKSKLKNSLDPSQILCCEVCGKYGLPQDFSASGRFCSLSCVGMYTGRRNKGREFVRHVKTLDGKILKKRKKGKKKMGNSVTSSLQSKATEANVKQEQVDSSTPDRATVVRGPRIKIRKYKLKNKHLMETNLMSMNDNVPYDSTKPFKWSEYVAACSATVAPVELFKQQNPHLEVIPKPCVEFKKDMKLEAMDPKHPSYICVCTVVKVKGCRMRLHFDGWSESYDFWTNCNSPFIYPVGWCEKNGQTLNPPRSYSLKDFVWEKYLKKCGTKAVPEHLFKPVSPTLHGFKVGMKLEAIDIKNPDLICVSTVTNVIGNRFLVHFDEWDDTYDYWCTDDCPYIHEVGWCDENDRRLTPPNDEDIGIFSWDEYLKTTGAVPAPKELFKTRPLPGFKRGMKIEAVDKRNPTLTRAATITDIDDYRVKVHFDGWDEIYDDWFEADSTDIHPVGWAEKTRHPLEPPLTLRDKISSAACPTPGCKGIGHVKGAKYTTHHSTFGCPYSLQNLNKDSCLVDRLSANSMTEESDWSYASKLKSGSVSKDTEGSPTSPPFSSSTPKPEMPSRLGTRHSSTSSVSSKSPKTGKPPVSFRRSPHHSPTAKAFPISSASPKGLSTSNSSIITTRSSTKRLTPKEEKPSQPLSRPNYVDKAIQHLSPYPFPWQSASTFLASDFLLNEAAIVSCGSSQKEREKIMKWTVDDVVSHLKTLGCPEQAKIFGEQQIDGEAFLLLTQNDIVNILKIKLGPALKIYKSIPK